MFPSESYELEASKETERGAPPEGGLHVKTATGGEFVTVHPVTSAKAIPSTPITAVNLAFTVITLSYHTSSAFDSQESKD